MAAFDALAAAFGDHIAEIIVTVMISDLVARLDRSDGAQDDLSIEIMRFCIRPARMVRIARDILAGRAVNGPAAVYLV